MVDMSEARSSAFIFDVNASAKADSSMVNALANDSDICVMAFVSLDRKSVV